MKNSGRKCHSGTIHCTGGWSEKLWCRKCHCVGRRPPAAQTLLLSLQALRLSPFLTFPQNHQTTKQRFSSTSKTLVFCCCRTITWRDMYSINIWYWLDLTGTGRVWASMWSRWSTLVIGIWNASQGHLHCYALTCNTMDSGHFLLWTEHSQCYALTLALTYTAANTHFTVRDTCTAMDWTHGQWTLGLLCSPPCFACLHSVLLCPPMFSRPSCCSASTILWPAVQWSGPPALTSENTWPLWYAALQKHTFAQKMLLGQSTTGSVCTKA